ncbi:hypothetical protein PR202_gb22402 [Eleusine coracana subsp. coracana]|uniref:Alpha/beta hydrolase fold-3 domain-containing protein n=1 Tax=Eleusine coracana subsp. coracana TaxID=191504 RepID=A0AAV5FDI3_ELECO|nr:hypothetical protein PR202_gb22402 [Eleusine coracana subsp. coracana]
MSKKLPVVVYIHGGAFIIGSAGDPTYHCYVNSLAAATGALVVSVDYRLAPEHPLPAAYDDSWAAFQWAASAQDAWIAQHGDLARLFLSGDSAGANIVHDVLVRAASSGGSDGPRIEGAVLCHPWFAGNQPIEGEPAGGPAASAGLWMYACPGAVGGADDPRDRAYFEAVAASAWPGTVEWLESDGEEHVFFLGKPECENARRLMDRVVAFIAGGTELGRL